MKLLAFLAPVLTALALVPGGAHLFALPNKIGLGEADYFTTQQVYRGWAWLGVVLFAALGANLLFALRLRGQRGFGAALLASALIAATLVVFFVWTFPANQATENWTAAPANWRELRAQWEYSHAVNAGLMFLALCASVAAGLRSARP